jgi:hypothetical protein
MRRVLVGTGVIAAVGVLFFVGAVGAAASGVPFVFGASTVHASVVPPGRVFEAGAASPTGDGMVIYGGSTAGNNSTPFGDTWTFDTVNGWVAQCGATRQSACAPGTRVSEGMATVANGVVLYGGFATGIGNTPLGDTWRWANNTWTQVCTVATCGPGARGLSAMAGNGNTAVLFGGLTNSGLADDTWVFNGTSWKQTCGTPLPTACGPSARIGAAMGWDGTHFVMFGGQTDLSGSSTPPVDETWVFNGTTWSKRCGTTSGGTACGPPARALATLSYAPNTNPALQAAVLLGGGDLFSNQTTSTLYRDAWIWNGTQWTKLTVSWGGPPVTFPANNGSPPASPDPLLGVAAPLAASCQVVFLGTHVVRSGTNPDVGLSTFIGGRDLNGDGQPDACTLPPTTTTTIGTTAATTTAELPNTGSSPTTPIAAALGLVACGAVALTVSGRARRRR